MHNREVIINRLVANSAEVITEDELRARFKSGDKPTHYIGFEISGYVHLGTGLMSALVMKDLIDLGVRCTVWLADWHTWINNKLDGTKETAARIGAGYFTEAMKASFEAVGGAPDALHFQLASSAYARDPMQYWEMVITGLNHTSQARLARSVTIMGREEGSEIDGAKLVYPAMQAADVFYLDVDIAHAGIDQRKAYVIMRDVASRIAPHRPKPVVLLHHLLPGLSSPAGKMSKSDPDSAIFVHDSPDQIARKVTKAFCPEKETKNNPVLAWTKLILFWNRTEPFRLERQSEHGGAVAFDSYAALEEAYAAGQVHPQDLKNAVARELTQLLVPVREHFAKPDVAAKKAELDRVLAERSS